MWFHVAQHRGYRYRTLLVTVARGCAPPLPCMRLCASSTRLSGAPAGSCTLVLPRPVSLAEATGCPASNRCSSAAVCWYNWTSLSSTCRASAKQILSSCSVHGLQPTPHAWYTNRCAAAAQCMGYSLHRMPAVYNDSTCTQLTHPCMVHT